MVKSRKISRERAVQITQSPSFKWNFKKSHHKDADLHGTINFLLYIGGVLYIGVDSLSTKKEMSGETEYRVYSKDQEAKVVEVIPGVVLTLSGNAERCRELLEYLRLKNSPNQDLLMVQSHVEEYLSLKKEKDIRKIKLFLVSNQNRECIAFKMGDGITSSLVTETPVALGSGSKYALRELRKLRYRPGSQLKPKVNLNDRIEDLFRALLKTSVSDKCCGGRLRVWQVSPDSCNELYISPTVRELYPIDAALYLNMAFDTRHMFFLYKEAYKLMNYHQLSVYLKKRLEYEVEEPSCLGIVHGEWKLLMPLLEDEIDCDFLLLSGAVSSDPRFRRVTVRQEGVDISLFMIMAAPDILREMRETDLLDSLN